MEHIRNDPELAQEMVQLLGNELRLLRQKLRDTEVEVRSIISCDQTTDLKC
jgi:hypothetical protein